MPGVAPPSNYNQIDLAADSQEIELSGYRIRRLITDVADRVEAVIALADRLDGSWTGNAAALATDAIGQWNAAAKRLFGAGDPRQGAINELVDGLITAAINFADAEQAVMTRFRGLFDPENPWWNGRFERWTPPPADSGGPATEVNPGVQVVTPATYQSINSGPPLLGH